MVPTSSWELGFQLGLNHGENKGILEPKMKTQNRKQKIQITHSGIS